MSLFDRLTAFFRPEPQMTDSEKDQKALAEHSCPDCGSIHLIGGPRGGAAQNVACANCLSEFNVIPGFMILIARMGKLSAERAKLYGIEVARA